jgi:hypothetical protein
LKIISLLILLGTFFVSCQPSQVHPVFSTPLSAPSTALVEENETPKMPLETPRIPLSPDYNLLSSQSVRLDKTALEEQVLFLQTKADLSLPIKILLVDYDQTRKTSYLAWEGSTLASGNKPFTYDFQDILGNHNKEILVRGLDDLGRPTLDIFNHVQMTGIHGFFLKRIFSLALKGSINILVTPRSAAYDSGESSDPSFPIITEQTDPDSSNGLGILRTTYDFQSQSDAYLKVKTEELPAGDQNDVVLQKLFSGDSQNFIQFLKGPWLKSDTTDLGLHPIIFFDPATKELTFATDTAQEVYHWDVLSRTMRNGLYIVGTNELINLINVQLSVSVVSADSINVNVQETPTWSGLYTRMPETLLEAAAKNQASALPQIPLPTGTYRDEKENELQFNSPMVTWTSQGVKKVYAASLFRLNKQLYFQLEPEDSKDTAHEKTFLFQESSEKTSSQVIRDVTLQAGSLSVQGWLANGREPMRFEQIELLSETR